ncbi:MAG: hypothetical protein Q8N88_00995 [Nanoarchaeota archaeon]|nr:hypothetical protein [Nanoarchaeota archaeon]
MEKRGLVILVIVAILLLITAITLQASDSKEIKTTRSELRGSSGEVGVTVVSPQVEDKFLENQNE